MSIHTLFTDQAIVQRLKTSSGYRKQYISTTTAQVNIQPVGQSERQGLPNVDSKDYVMYCDIRENIKKNDKIIVVKKDSTGFTLDTKTFTVKSIEYRTATGITEHLEIQLELLK